MVYWRSPKPSSEVRFLHRPPSLLFRLLVFRALAAPIAKLRKFYLTLYCFFIFLAPIIDALALLAREFYKPVLGHKLFLAPDVDGFQTSGVYHSIFYKK